MGQQDVEFDRQVLCHPHTERAQPGAGVEHEDMTACEAHLDA